MRKLTMQVFAGVSESGSNWHGNATVSLTGAFKRLRGAIRKNKDVPNRKPSYYLDVRHSNVKNQEDGSKQYFTQLELEDLDQAIINQTVSLAINNGKGEMELVQSDSGKWRITSSSDSTQVALIENADTCIGKAIDAVPAAKQEPVQSEESQIENA